MRSTRRWTFGAVALAAWTGAAAHGAAWYVDPTAPMGGDGRSWATAMPFLADALLAAGTGDEIRVAQGAHHPDRDADHPGGTGDRGTSFTVPSGVAVRGGYAGLAGVDPDERDPETFVTVLDGGGLAYHVVRGDGWSTDTRLDGVRITGGRADGAGDAALGGGLLIGGASAGWVRDCVIEGNTARQGGGALLRAGATTHLDGLTIRGNTATVSGGGLQSTNAAPNLAFTVVVGNEAPNGQGGGAFILGNAPDATAMLIDAHFENNTAERGGGLAVVSGSPRIVSTTFIDNLARTGGGAAFEHTGTVGSALVDCRFETNFALDDGGGLAESSIGIGVTIDGCTFLDNVAVNDGGAIHGSGPGTATIEDVLVTGNLAGDRGGGLFWEGGHESTVVSHLVAEANEADGGGGAALVNAPIRIAASRFEANTAAAGGGLDAQGGTAVISGSVFRANTSTGSGAGARLAHAEMTLDSCTFEQNTAANTGAGLQVIGDASTVRGCLFAANVASGFGSGGGAAAAEGATTRFEQCVFTANTADFGGGLAASGAAAPVVVDSSFFENIGRGGAGVSVVSAAIDIDGCLLRGNRAESSTISSGGGLSVVLGTATVRDSRLEANHADSDGGAIVARDSTLAVARATLVANTALERGGGLSTDGSMATVIDTIFAGNVGGTLGGGAHAADGAVTFIDCAFTGNRAIGVIEPTGLADDECAEPGFGGALGARTGAPRLVNCTLVGNVAECEGLGGGVSTIFGTLVNCVLWDNIDANGSGEGAQLHDLAGLTQVAYSCVRGLESIAGPGNFGDDPLLRDADGDDDVPGTDDDDLRAGAGSPCIDAADNTALDADVVHDLAGAARFVDDPDTRDTGVTDARPPADVGAFEFDPEATCDGDVDGDGAVGIGDLLAVLGAWGPCPGCAADLDGDGEAGVGDLLIVLAQWGCA